MPHKTRLILFYLLVVVFLTGGTGVLLYSYGWRISLETGTIQKIGAIYIKTNVGNTSITLNGKPFKDASGILQSGTLISNLIPKTYQVSIAKEGYHTYHKTLVVHPSQVTEILNVQLIPDTFESTFVAPTKGTRFVDATRSADNMIVQDAATGIYYLSGKANASAARNLNLAIARAQKGMKIKKIMFVPFKPTQFIVEDASGLKLFDSEKNTVELLEKGPIIAWNMQDSTIVGVELASATGKTNAQKAFAFNLIFKSKTTFDDLNASIATTTRIAALATTGNGSIAFSDANHELSLFDPKTKTIRHIANDVVSFMFSPDGKKMAFVEKTGTLRILFIEDFDGDIRKKSGDAITIALAQENPAQAVQWYADSYHLLVTLPGELVITELDDRKPTNTFPLLSGSSEYRYGAENNSIYFIDQKGINAIRIEK